MKLWVFINCYKFLRWFLYVYMKFESFGKILLIIIFLYKRVLVIWYDFDYESNFLLYK